MKIFRQNIEGKAKYFNEQGQTTLENLTFLTSDQEISTFKHIVKLLIPEELIYLFYQPEEIEKIISDVRNEKCEELLKILKRKWIWNETGDDAHLSDIIEYEFKLEIKVLKFKSLLKRRQFNIKKLNEFIAFFNDDVIIKIKEI